MVGTTPTLAQTPSADSAAASMEIAHEEGREWPALGTQPRPKESRFSGCLELGLGRIDQ